MPFLSFAARFLAYKHINIIRNEVKEAYSSYSQDGCLKHQTSAISESSHWTRVPTTGLRIPIGAIFGVVALQTTWKIYADHCEVFTRDPFSKRTMIYSEVLQALGSVLMRKFPFK